MKLKEWIRNKLVSFIMLDTVQEHLLSEIHRLDKYDDTLAGRIQHTNASVNSNKEEMDILHNTIRSIVSVGADVVPNVQSRDRSWAVVCIEGKYNIVKFIDLQGADYRRILDFLKQYEGSRMVIDAPSFTYFEKEFKMK